MVFYQLVMSFIDHILRRMLAVKFVVHGMKQLSMFSWTARWLVYFGKTQELLQESNYHGFMSGRGLVTFYNLIFVHGRMRL
jgi:putative NADPH-quinone reductase